MSEQKHTPEPWSWGWEDASILYIYGPREAEDHVLWAGLCKACAERRARCTAPTDADADRIVACVNALAGMNPEHLGELLDEVDRHLLAEHDDGRKLPHLTRVLARVRGEEGS